MTQHLATTRRTWKSLARTRLRTDEHYRVKMNENVLMLLELEKSILSVLDVCDSSLFVFQRVEVYENFSYVDTTSPTAEMLTAETSDGVEYGYSIAACFNYSKMTKKKPIDSLGDEYECFLIKCIKHDALCITSDDGSSIFQNIIGFVWLGFERKFNVSMDNFYEEVAMLLLEDYHYSMCLDHPKGHVRRVRALH
jgi:hypothetical protein